MPLLTGRQKRTVNTACGRVFSGNPQTVDKLVATHGRYCATCGPYIAPQFDHENAITNGFNGIGAKDRLATSRIGQGVYNCGQTVEVDLKKK